MNRHLARQNRAARRGATLVEFAVTAPVLFLIFFASLEFSRANMLRHTAENAAYEGARAGIVPGSTAEKAETAANNVLAPVGVQNAVVTITPSTITPGDDEVRVDVSIPMNDNGYFMPLFFAGKNISVGCTLSREVTGLEATGS